MIRCFIMHQCVSSHVFENNAYLYMIYCNVNTSTAHLYECAYESSYRFFVKKTCCRLRMRRVFHQCEYAYVSLEHLFEKMVCHTNYTRTASLQCVFACEYSGYNFVKMIWCKVNKSFQIYNLCIMLSYEIHR